MEILRSEVAAGIKESTKQKFVKQICSLLDIIQYHVGGFFGDESLESYVGRTLKSRYTYHYGSSKIMFCTMFIVFFKCLCLLCDLVL